MSTPDPAVLVQLALGVFPPLPAIVEVLSEDGGGYPLRIVACEDGLLHAFAPRTQVRKELRLLARITDEQRGRYEVEFEIAEIFYHSSTDALVHMAVTGVQHRKMRRAAPRVSVSERAHARVLFCRTLPRHHTIDVRLSDVSTTGIGFTSVNELAAGDLLVVTVTLSGKPVDVETRVVRVDPAPYGRFRIGGEITELAEVDRRLIAEMAMRTPEAGSEAERGSGSAAGASLTR